MNGKKFKAGCCKKCPHDETSNCTAERCGKWQTWFREEWTNIRIAAEALKIVKREKTRREKIRIIPASERSEKTNDEGANDE